MNVYEVIKTVSVTEKSKNLTTLKQYTFVVHPKASKQQIKRAVQELFDRKVKSVNVMNRLGKTRRTRFGTGKKPNWRKAIVTLQDGQEPLELF